MGTRAGLDAVAKRKDPCQWRESNSDHPAHSLDTILTETASGIHCIRNWVGPTAGPGTVVAKRKVLPLPGTELQSSSPSHLPDFTSRSLK